MVCRRGYNYSVTSFVGRVTTTVLLGVPVFCQLQCCLVCTIVIPITVLFGVYQCGTKCNVVWCTCVGLTTVLLGAYQCGANYSVILCTNYSFTWFVDGVTITVLLGL